MWHDRLDGRSEKENMESLVYDSLNKLIIGILTLQRIPYICIQMPQVWKYMYKLITFLVNFVFKKESIFLIQNEYVHQKPPNVGTSLLIQWLRIHPPMQGNGLHPWPGN